MRILPNQGEAASVFKKFATDSARASSPFSTCRRIQRGMVGVFSRPTILVKRATICCSTALSTERCVVLTIRKWHIWLMSSKDTAMFTGISNCKRSGFFSAAKTKPAIRCCPSTTLKGPISLTSNVTVFVAESNEMSLFVAKKIEVGKNASFSVWPSTRYSASLLARPSFRRR